MNLTRQTSHIRPIHCALGIMHFAVLTAMAAPSLSVDSVAQRWPWNNKVDITYTIADSGQDLANGVYRKLMFEVNIPGKTSPVVIDGSDDVIAPVKDGTYTVTWTPPADLAVKASGCTVTAKLYATDGDYMIIDLDSGKYVFQDLADGATPAERQANSNARYNTGLYNGQATDECRMVLRRVAKGGTYPTGENYFAAEQNKACTNACTCWTTDRDYFIGVFMTTQRQWKKFATSYQYPNGQPSWLSSWNTLRNSQPPAATLTKNASGGSYLEWLNTKTGLLGFDLPTEVMWEIAARAGRDGTPHWWGSAKPDGTVGVMGKSNRVQVGTCAANDWGLYDISGNLWELTRDGASLGDMTAAPDAFTPAAMPANDKVVVRGGPQYNIWGNSKPEDYWRISYRAPSSNQDHSAQISRTSTSRCAFRIAWYYVGE